jgi:hypothetical protein
MNQVPEHLKSAEQVHQDFVSSTQSIYLVYFKHIRYGAIRPWDRRTVCGKQDLEKLIFKEALVADILAYKVISDGEYKLVFATAEKKCILCASKNNLQYPYYGEYSLQRVFRSHICNNCLEREINNTLDANLATGYTQRWTARQKVLLETLNGVPPAKHMWFDE